MGRTGEVNATIRADRISLRGDEYAGACEQDMPYNGAKELIRTLVVVPLARVAHLYAGHLPRRQLLPEERHPVPLLRQVPPHLPRPARGLHVGPDVVAVVQLADLGSSRRAAKSGTEAGVGADSGQGGTDSRVKERK